MLAKLELFFLTLTSIRHKMLASYASTATEAYNQQVGVCGCKSYQSVTGVKLSISSCVQPPRVHLYTTLLLLVQIRLARTS